MDRTNARRWTDRLWLVSLVSGCIIALTLACDDAGSPSASPDAAVDGPSTAPDAAPPASDGPPALNPDGAPTDQRTPDGGGDPSSLPLVTLADFEYLGGFRFPADKHGSSELNYSQGPLAYNPKNNSVFLVGHAQQQHLAELKLPKLVKSTDVSALKIAGPPLQGFVSILDRVANPQGLDRIGGLHYFDTPGGGELLINAYEYYDAAADNTQTTLALRDASKLGSSAASGYLSFAGGAGHTSGWISPIPPEWQPLLGGSYITGHSSGIPIIGRCSVGPSAFAFDHTQVVGNAAAPKTIATTTLLDFSLDEPLHQDLDNADPSNDLWNHLSRAVYGFIAAGSRSYVTLGSSGGHKSGVCYKCTQSDGNLCGGYCAKDSDDYARYYWLWDVNDLVAVKQGLKLPHAIRPYEYGELPQQIPGNELGGGSYDLASNTLYLTVQGADRLQGQYANPPVVVAYRINVR